MGILHDTTTLAVLTNNTAASFCIYVYIEYRSPIPKTPMAQYSLPIVQSQESNFGVIIISLVYTKEALKCNNIQQQQSSNLVCSSMLGGVPSLACTVQRHRPVSASLPASSEYTLP